MKHMKETSTSSPDKNDAALEAKLKAEREKAEAEHALAQAKALEVWDEGFI